MIDYRSATLVSIVLVLAASCQPKKKSGGGAPAQPPVSVSQISIAVTNAGGTTGQSFNFAPGEPVRLTIRATGVPQIALGITGAPAGSQLTPDASPANGIFTWTPAAGQTAGSFTVIARDIAACQSRESDQSQCAAAALQNATAKPYDKTLTVNITVGAGTQLPPVNGIPTIPPGGVPGNPTAILAILGPLLQGAGPAGTALLAVITPLLNSPQGGGALIQQLTTLLGQPGATGNLPALIASITQMIGGGTNAPGAPATATPTPSPTRTPIR